MTSPGKVTKTANPMTRGSAPRGRYGKAFGEADRAARHGLSPSTRARVWLVREHRGERDVHPDIDRTELFLHPLRRALELLEAGGVHLRRQCRSARRPHFPRGALQPFLTSCEQGHLRRASTERTRRGTTDATTGAGHHDHLPVPAHTRTSSPSARG